MINSKFIMIILSYFIRFSHPRHGFFSRPDLAWSDILGAVLYCTGLVRVLSGSISVVDVASFPFNTPRLDRGYEY